MEKVKVSFKLTNISGSNTVVLELEDSRNEKAIYDALLVKIEEGLTRLRNHVPQMVPTIFLLEYEDMWRHADITFPFVPYPTKQ